MFYCALYQLISFLFFLCGTVYSLQASAWCLAATGLHVVGKTTFQKAQGPDRQGPDSRKAPDRQGPDRQGPDRNGPDRQGPDRQGAD